MDRPGRVAIGITLAAGVLGLLLLSNESYTSSATYDEVTYLELASQWWRGKADSTITRMGSPATFYKLQPAVTFVILDATGHGDWIDNAVRDQAMLLPIMRLGSLWIWLIAFSLTVYWARRIYGLHAMACAAVMFTFSPNLLAHGNLITMEFPLIACTTTMSLLFWQFMETKNRWAFLGSAVIGGLAFSCKFTAIVFPFILGFMWLIDLKLIQKQKTFRSLLKVIASMLGYVLVLLIANLVITGFATLPASERVGDHPAVSGLFSRLVEWRWPVDWVGFATQLRHQKNGGPSYLFGERRMTGWWYYYPVALAVKLPIACLILLAAATFRTLKFPPIKRDWIFPSAITIFMLLAMLGSKRNYGVRYLLPLAPLAIVWISGLAERSGRWRSLVYMGLVGQVIAVVSVFPHELSFFNRAAGGTRGGRHILADSNLDWGQGLRSFAKLEKTLDPPEPITLFYFGLADPVAYGVRCQTYTITANEPFPPLPESLNDVNTSYIGVSASLQHGPWGPQGYFDPLNGRKPIAFTDDGTIAIYRVSHWPY